MDNPEEYVLQVFRSAQGMLEDELAAEHADRLTRFGEKITHAADLVAEAERIKGVEGFSTAGIALEWLNGRAKHDTEFNLDRFDADVHLLYESLLIGFKDLPHIAAAKQEPTPGTAPAPQAVRADSFGLPEPDWNSGGAPSDAAPGQAASGGEGGPSFVELLDQPMLLTVRRLADSASAFDQKPEAERTTSLAVMKMMSKGIVDMARPQNKIVVTDTFQEIAGFIESIERRGESRAESTAAAMAGIGGILSAAFRDTTSGMKYMTRIKGFISARKENGMK